MYRALARELYKTTKLGKRSQVFNCLISASTCKSHKNAMDFLPEDAQCIHLLCCKLHKALPQHHFKGLLWRGLQCPQVTRLDFHHWSSSEPGKGCCKTAGKVAWDHRAKPTHWARGWESKTSNKRVAKNCQQNRDKSLLQKEIGDKEWAHPQVRVERMLFPVS